MPEEVNDSLLKVFLVRVRVSETVSVVQSSSKVDNKKVHIEKGARETGNNGKCRRLTAFWVAA